MRILLIEDSERLRGAVARGLRKEGYAVDEAKDGKEGLWLVSENPYDVVVLDLGLPQIDGLTVLRRMREKDVRSHVLILSARDQVEDRVQGLTLGADDYLTKPFSFDELTARIRALLRRNYNAKSPVLKVGEVALTTATRRVTVGEREVKLTPREYALLEILLFRAGEVVSRQELWESLYEFEAEVSSNVVDVMVCSLRKKLGNDGVIQTKRGHGYLVERDAS
ncbi:MAG: response regulator transcription factor [Thermoanaerobaculia bacterium]|nr:response regulator transcription factor [Thermoanaerobaculia bacterium]